MSLTLQEPVLVLYKLKGLQFKNILSNQLQVYTAIDSLRTALKSSVYFANHSKPIDPIWPRIDNRCDQSTINVI